jgi:hypothetical protein
MRFDIVYRLSKNESDSSSLVEWKPRTATMTAVPRIRNTYVTNLPTGFGA